MRVLIFGLPGTGKTSLAKQIIRRIPCLYLNGDLVRKACNDKDFSNKGRVNQARRMRALAGMANRMPVIADFVCPTHQTRRIFNADFSVWMNTATRCQYKNTNKIFQAPKKADVVITTKDAPTHALRIIKTLKALSKLNSKKKNA